MKKILVLALLLLISHVTLLQAEELSARPAENRFLEELSARPAENRFLFVIENSLAMNRSAKAVEKTLRELIESGVQGQMLPGDSFGLWTFNEQLDTSFELQHWVPSERQKLANTATDFFKKRRYAKKAAMQSVLPPLFSVVKGSRAITVILISTGNQPITGTPFDQAINGIYANYSRELQNSKLPFVTVLVGRKGRLVTYAVNSALGPFQIPSRPIEPDPVVVKTNAPIEVAKPSLVTNEPPKRYAKENIIITGSVPKKQLAPPVAATNVPILANEPVILPIEKTKVPPVANSIPGTPSLIAEPTQTVALTETQTAIVRFDDPTTFKPQTQSLNGVVENLPEPRFKRREDGSINTAPIAPDVFTNTSENIPAQIPAVVATQPTSVRKNFMLIGLALLVIAGILLVFFVRSARTNSQPSIISRSMNDRK